MTPQQATGPLRPSLQRSNASTPCLPVVDSTDANGKRRPSLSTARMAALNAASAHSSPLASPTVPRSNGPQRSYFDGTASSVDMARNDSSDSQRSLKSKHSRKELKELARSTTPLPSLHKSSKNSGKHADQGDDDDARSIDSFCCTYTNEFDRQHRAHSVASKSENSQTRQRWLDATFRKLSQKSGLQRQGHLSRAMQPPSSRREEQHGMPTIRDAEPQTPDTASQPTSPSRSKAHFLDFSTIISPIPSAAGALTVPSNTHLPSSTNVTPRPADYSRFPPPPPVPSPGFCRDVHDARPPQPMLRTRRSEDSLTVRRRTQRQQSLTGVGSPQFAELALAGHPVPQLPDWARSENHTKGRSRHHGSDSAASGTSADMSRAVSNDVVGLGRRPVDMSRAASHDAGSLQLSLGPSLMSNFERWKADEIPISPTHPCPRGQSSLEDHNLRPSFAPMSFSQSTSSTKHTAHGMSLDRGSISSATSDSDISSSISSVPQTPVSRFNALSACPMIRRESESRANSVYYDTDPMFDATHMGEDHLSFIRARWMEENAQSKPPPMASPSYYAPTRAAPRAGQQVASIFEATGGENQPAMATRVSHLPVASLSHSKGYEGDATVRIHAQQGRPRAATTSSTTAPSAVPSLVSSRNDSRRSSRNDSIPVRPSRSSSLHHSRSGSGSSNKRTSVASNNSAGTTTSSSASSSSTTSSGASALLSYMRSHSSKSHSNLSNLSDAHSKTPSSSGTLHAPSSPTKRGIVAEDLAASLNRRLGHSIAADGRGQ